MSERKTAPRLPVGQCRRVAEPLTAPRPGDTLTTTEAAKLCGVAPRTISKWIDTGQLKGYRVPLSGDRRVHAADLIAFLLANGMFREIGPATITILVRPLSAKLTERWGSAVLRVLPSGVEDESAYDLMPGGPRFVVKAGSDAVVSLLERAGYEFEDGR